MPSVAIDEAERLFNYGGNVTDRSRMIDGLRVFRCPGECIELNATMRKASIRVTS